MTQAVAIAAGVTYHRGLNSDDYIGAAEALVAAGYIRPDQVPGVGANGTSMVSFTADGSRVSRGNSTACRQAGYVKVRPTGQRRLWVEIRVSEDESFARRSAYLKQKRREADELAERAKSWPFPIWGAHLLEVRS